MTKNAPFLMHEMESGTIEIVQPVSSEERILMVTILFDAIAEARHDGGDDLLRKSYAGQWAERRFAAS